MGQFVNPDNSSFMEAVNSEIYVDKSGLIDCTNKLICTKQKYICNSRPRRFGYALSCYVVICIYIYRTKMCEFSMF